MDNKYLMGKNDKLDRFLTSKKNETYINPTLRKSLLKLSIKKAFNFYINFFNFKNIVIDIDELIIDYDNEFNHANKIGLFRKGGIREKDHLNLWCLGRVLSPQLYIESGVFIGSSLHAFLKSPSLNKIIAIDPNLKSLKINTQDFPLIELIDKNDFSQIKINHVPTNSLAYFDDHINSANRIIQSHEKGIKYLLFDDSTGLEGICQRLYPAIPTIPMIMNWESFNLNDEISWTWLEVENPKIDLNWFINKLLRGNKAKNKRVTLKIDEEIINQCKLAKNLIKRHTIIPDLGLYLPQKFPEKMVDTSKYLIELNI